MRAAARSRMVEATAGVHEDGEGARSVTWRLQPLAATAGRAFAWRSLPRHTDDTGVGTGCSFQATQIE